MSYIVFCACEATPCSCDPAVTFDYGTWITRYPQFSCSVTKQQASLLFDEATLYLNNDMWPTCSGAKRLVLFGMLVAHIAELNARAVRAGVGSAMTGQVNNASEGSVSIGLQPLGATGAGDSPGAAWYNQTPYGAAFWRATSGYRMARYIPGPRPFLGVSPGDPWGIFRRVP